MKTTPTPLRRVLLAIALAATLAACSNSSESSTTVADDTPTADVTTFCTSASTVAGQIAELMANPAAGDLAALNAQAQAIGATATKLAKAHPGQTAAISACFATVTAAISGGVTVGEPGLSTTVPGGDTTSSNPAVQAFCASADVLAAQLQATLADPAKAGDMATLTAQVQDLATQAAAIISGSPADAQQVTACTQKMADALIPGVATPTETVAPLATVAPDATAAPGTTAGATSSNPDVAAYCAAADAVAAQLTIVMADPAKAGDMAALTTQMQDLSTKAAALGSTSPADVAAVQACTDRMLAALTPGT